MTNSLFNEALNDAKAIRQAAEERAKQQLLETMSPKLKKIVETTINKEMGLDETDFEESDEYSEGQFGVDPAQASGKIGEVDLSEDSVEECGTGGYMGEEESPYMQTEAKKVLNMLLTKDVLKRNLQTEVNNFIKDVSSLKKTYSLMETHRVTQHTVNKVDKTLLKLVENSKNIASNDIIKNQTELKQKFNNALQELNQMTRRRNNILAENYASLNRRSRRLFEAEDEGEDELAGGEDMDMGGEDMGGDEEMDMGGEDMDMGGAGGELADADASELRSIADKIEAMLGGGGAGGEEEMDMGGEEDMGDEEEGEEEEEPKTEWSRRRGNLFYEADELDVEDEDELDSDLEGADMHMHAESYFYESSKSKKQKLADEKKKKLESDKKKKEKEKLKEGDVFLEIDENMLRREIARMKRLREGDAESMASHFGGGKLEDEMFVDVDDSDLNVHANNLGSFHKGGKSLKEGRSYNSNGQTRLLESKVQNYQKALTGMKSQLSEMTLFNAKLLYANKLMQNRDLTASQQRHIVESLDQARNVREAKLLFEGLSKSLMRGTSRSGSLNESATRRIAGGSSRSTSSAQSQNQFETNRWALLAGIKK